MRANYPLTLLYDAGCAVCSLEMDHLRARNVNGALQFIDISAPGFDAAVYGGASLADLNAEIHGVRPDGSVIRGVQVLRLAYEAAGLGWVLRPTGWPVLRPVFDAAYRVFARNRQTISRVASVPIAALRGWRARRTLARMNACMNDCPHGKCEVPARGERTATERSTS